MNEKKKKSKVWVVLLVVIALIAIGVFAYTKYLNGDFNEVLAKNEATKDLVVVDLDTDKHNEETKQEYELKNGVESDYYFDEEGKVEIVNVELEVPSSEVNKATLIATQTACKALKGVNFSYEENDGNYEFDITVAPNDIDEEVFNKALALNILNEDQVKQCKEVLNDPTPEKINALIEDFKY